MSKYIDAEQFKWDNERLLHCDFPYLSEETLGELIDNAPAADVAEVRHGRWRHYEGMLTCSVCGTDYYDDIMEYLGDDVPRYCPNCGSRMDLECEDD